MPKTLASEDRADEDRAKTKTKGRGRTSIAAMDRRELIFGTQTLLIATAALFLLVLWAGNILFRYAGETAGNDFWDAYLRAARHLIDGQALYMPTLLSGPFPAQTAQAYLYPPTFAWLLTPLLLIPQDISTGLWALAQGILLGLSVWIAATAAGARKSWRLFFLLMMAVTVFSPDMDTVISGNVGAIIALGTALLLRSAVRDPRGDRSAGPLGVALGVLKLTPGLMLLPILLANPRRHIPRAILATLLLIVPFFLLNAGVWFDFLRAPYNLAVGSNWYGNNLAPNVVFPYYWPGTADLAPELRFATLALAAGLLIASLYLARRSGGLPLAILAASAVSLLVPGAIWTHYLTALIPGVVFTLVRANNRWRSVIIICLLLSWPIPVMMPIFSLAAIVLMVVPLFVLWPPKAEMGLADQSSKHMAQDLQSGPAA